MKFNEISMKINQNVELLGFIDFTGNFIDFHGLMHYNKIVIIGISYMSLDVYCIWLVLYCIQYGKVMRLNNLQYRTALSNLLHNAVIDEILYSAGLYNTYITASEYSKL